MTATTVPVNIVVAEKNVFTIDGKIVDSMEKRSILMMQHFQEQDKIKESVTKRLLNAGVTLKSKNSGNSPEDGERSGSTLRARSFLRYETGDVNSQDLRSTE